MDLVHSGYWAMVWACRPDRAAGVNSPGGWSPVITGSTPAQTDHTRLHGWRGKRKRKMKGRAGRSSVSRCQLAKVATAPRGRTFTCRPVPGRPATWTQGPAPTACAHTPYLDRGPYIYMPLR